MDSVDFADPVQAQNYLLCLRELMLELAALKSDPVQAVMAKYAVFPVYAPGDKVQYRVNIDFPASQMVIK